MKRLRNLKMLLAALLCAIVLSPAVAPACSVCYGDPDSSQTKGLMWGIAVLLGVVGTVLGGITTFFVYLAKKSPAESSTQSPTDKIQ